MRPLRSLLVAVALTAVTATLAAPAEAGLVDITPPEVGSCHDLSVEEATQWTDPAEPVDCTTVHTTETFRVLELEGTPDWDDKEALYDLVEPRCLSGLRSYLGGTQKALEMSAYFVLWYLPTAAQREAGATWVRCDLAVLGRSKLRRLPTHRPPSLGSLPLDDDIARCRFRYKDGNYYVTACAQTHAYRAKEAVRFDDGPYPGLRSMREFAIRKCSKRLPHQGFYWEVPVRSEWRAGWRYAICYQSTSDAGGGSRRVPVGGAGPDGLPKARA